MLHPLLAHVSMAAIIVALPVDILDLDIGSLRQTYPKGRRQSVWLACIHCAVRAFRRRWLILFSGEPVNHHRNLYCQVEY